MKKSFLIKYYALILLVLSSLDLSAQIEQGQITIGVDNGNAGHSIVQTTDGGYVIAGYTNTYGAGQGDMYVVKLDELGNLKWTKTIGGTNADIGTTIVQTKDGGFAVLGSTQSFGNGNFDFYLVKLDSIGYLKWSKTIGGIGIDYGYSMVQTNDGGYAITGQTYSFGTGNGDVYIVKLDSIGGLKWTRTIGGSDYDAGLSIVQTNDGGFAVAGASEIGHYPTTGSNHLIVMKLDSVGQLVWTETIGGTGNDIGNSIKQTKDGGFVIAGSTESYGAGGSDVYIVRLDAAGNLNWTKAIGGTKGDVGNSVVETKDKGYVIMGQTYSFGTGNGDAYVIKLDQGGNLKWTKTIGGASSHHCYSIIQTKEGGYAAAGIISSGNGSLYMLKLDSTGSTCDTTGSGGSVSSGGTLSGGESITSSNNGNLSSGGTESVGGTITDICSTFVFVNNISGLVNNVKIFPNPGNGIFNISGELINQQSHIDIYNIFGQKIFTSAINSENKQINLNNEPNGLYFYRLFTGQEGLIEEKFILQK